MNPDEKKKRVSQWLGRKYRNWMKENDQNLTRGKFADYLDVKYYLLTKWLAGTALPGNDNVIKVANKLGPEIYDLLGWVKPKSD